MLRVHFKGGKENMSNTKECPSCDKEIGSNETKCPACGIEIEELENAIATISKANEVIEKRKKKITPTEPVPVTEPTTKTSIFTSMGSVLRKRS
jgi:predicted RNA-binding Zn-ribbon protein involved in translation (DUF1610 family)